MPTPSSLSSLTTSHGLISSFSTFLTIAIHTILSARAVYPPASFLAARAYNHPVRQNRHPRVCAWITDAVRAVEVQLRTGDVARVVVVLFAPPGSGRRQRALERFVFDVGRLPVVSAGKGDAVIVREGEEMGDGEERDDGAERRMMADLEEEFRAVMGRLMGCGQRLAPIPEGCTFTVAMELKTDGKAPVGHPQAWIPAEGPLQARREGEAGGGEDGRVVRGGDLEGQKVTAVRTVDVGEMAFEMWIEEGKAKWDDG
ncbi:DNA-binding protein [Eremomyces bilateralis CBS 781.70]|uniref:DNA-binding protein n=1 Tax=Eremomyces bilateralis CBS 781.70 TaxID=1392243 RepID=A0A6G1GGY7_9PEZI|nr:DNA-binding protein [Eremomyces bilateralis CBS 781.70]KAF1817313.1 DNA-binding protein [Eremomyces bilateralis CBS 781.70]